MCNLSYDLKFLNNNSLNDLKFLDDHFNCSNSSNSSKANLENNDSSSLSSSQLDYEKFINNYDFLKILSSTKDLEKIFATSFMRRWVRFKNFIIFGTGGSILSAQLFHELAFGEKYIKNTILKKRVKFADNLDPIALGEVFSDVLYARTGFLFISKSGETLETNTQFLYFLEKLKAQITAKYPLNSADKVVRILQRNVIIITEDKISTLSNYAKEHSIFTLPYPSQIGGRFSVFSIVGMLPAKIFGLDPIKIRKNTFNKLEIIYQNAKKSAIFNHQSYQKNISQNVFFVYSKRLLPFAKWIAQLYAESTGKNQHGVTPIIAYGSVDQHSQLQLYLDGKRDKNFTFIAENYTRLQNVKKEDTNTLNLDEQNQTNLDKSFEQPEKIIDQNEVAKIFRTQYLACSKIIARSADVRNIELNFLDPSEAIGEILAHFMIEVVIFCDLIKVNAFDQNAVELVKKRTDELLVSF